MSSVSGVRGFPGTARSDRDLHAWQGPDAEDLAHPDLQSPLVAEDSRECHDGSVSGVRPGARHARDRYGAEGDDSPPQVVQDEVFMC